MEPTGIASLAERLAGYLAGDRSADFKTQETFRQLAQRVLTPLSPNEAALLRQAPAAHRTLLFGALSEALRNDPVARHLAAEVGVPETAKSPSAPQRPQAFGDFHVNVTGNGNVVGHGNTIGSVGSPQAAEPQRKERRIPVIKILFLSASPDEVTTLRTDREVRDIQEALRQSEFRDRFELKQEPAVRISDVQRCLLQHRPDILHFSGHGDERGAILLEGRNGNLCPLLSGDLAALLSVLKDRTRCVVLNSCYSAQEVEPIADVIASVIARPDAVTDSAAILFSTYFYQALAFGRSVRAAFDLGCLQLRMEGWDDGAKPLLLTARCDPEEIRFVETAEELGQRAQPF